MLSFGAIEGFRGRNPDRADIASAEQFVKKWVPQAFEKVGYSPFADLVEAEVSIKPENWTGIGDEEQINAQIAQVKGARLEGMDLRYASADGAFLTIQEPGVSALIQPLAVGKLRREGPPTLPTACPGKNGDRRKTPAGQTVRPNGAAQ